MPCMYAMLSFNRNLYNMASIMQQAHELPFVPQQLEHNNLTKVISTTIAMYCSYRTGGYSSVQST